MNNFSGFPSLSGVVAHRAVPEGETIGTSFAYDGETYYVTQKELDRVKNLPSAEEMTAIVARFNKIRLGALARESD